MKRALLEYAKQRFIEMQQSNNEDQKSSSTKLAAPISPTPNLLIETFLPRLNLNSNSLLVDLGCGDGRWLIAANKHTKCHCLGIDVDEERLAIARKSICDNQLQNMVRVRNQDVFEFVKRSDEFIEADVIVIYLFREAMLEMGSLIRKRLSGSKKNSSRTKGIQILSVGFAREDSRVFTIQLRVLARYQDLHS